MLRPTAAARGPRYLAVVTYGRTGSTALQAALNSLPGVCIRGENYAAMRGLRQYVQSITETASRHHAGRPTHPWYGSARLDPTDVLADLRRHVVDVVLRPPRGTRIIGFKEIRYEPGHFADYDDMLDYLIFLDKLLPGIGYLMNVRDPKAVARSGWWPDRPDAIASLEVARDWLSDATADLNRHFAHGRRPHQARPGPGDLRERAVLVEYESWSADPGILIDALARLGLPRDDAAIRSALGTRLDHGHHSGDR